MLLTSALFSLGSCEDPTELGVDLPGNTGISTEFEDFPVQAATVWQDSLATLKRDHYLVGRLTDGNTGGRLLAQSYLDIKPSADSLPSQFTNPQLDSVVLFAGFNRVYGSAAQPVKLNVYDLAQPLSENAVYNSTSQIPLGRPVAENVEASLNRVIRNRANTADSIQLPLRLPIYTGGQPNAFVSDLFDLLKTASAPLSQQQLLTRWKGIGLTPAAGFSGTVVGFSRSPFSQVFVYYHTLVGTTKKKKTFRVLYNDPNTDVNPAAPSASALRYFTYINYDLSNGAFSQLHNNGAAQVPSAVSSEVTYSQDGTSLASKLVIPGLDALRSRQSQGTLIVNRAELIIPVKPYSTAQFAAPARLYLYEATATNRVLIRQSNLDAFERIVQRDGQNQRGQRQEAALTLNAAGTQYSGLITSYVQAYITDQLDGPRPEAFLLSPVLRSSGLLSLDRAAIDARNIRLRVYFSKPSAR